MVLSTSEIDEIRSIGDNSNCMTLKGAAADRSGDERPDRWPLTPELIATGARWGIEPERDLAPTVCCRLLQLALQDLAGGVARQLVEEADLARHLEAGEVLLDVLLQVVLGRLLRRSSHDEAIRRWPNSSSSTPIAASLGDASWRASRSSTSFGKTFSPPETIISSSRPSTNRRPALVEAADVAGRHQPVDHVLVAAAGVALEQHLVADEDAAGLACGTWPPFSSKIFSAVPRGGVPAVPGAARRSAGVAIVAQATSVEP